MCATFYGGPADGGMLTLIEPIRTTLAFPMSHADAIRLLAPQAHTRPTDVVPNTVPAAYQLQMIDGDRPFRDAHGRVRYLYLPARRPGQPQPREGTTDEDHRPGD